MTQLVSNGFRFDGSGYVVLSTSQTGWKPAVKVQITMKFKTYAPNGLLFFAGKDRDFISVELRDGLVLYQYDLGGGRVQMTYGFKEVNDGNWHYVQVNRVNKTGMVFVDSDGSMFEMFFRGFCWAVLYKHVLLGCNSASFQMYSFLISILPYIFVYTFLGLFKHLEFW